MRRSLSAALSGGVLLLVTALSASPAHAADASVPAPERTEVGAFVALWDGDGDGTYDRFDWVCSGAMIDSDTFLTAGHCTDDWPEGTRFFVSLEQDVQGLLDAGAGTAEEQAEAALAAGWIVEGDAHTMPTFGGPQSDYGDLGVLDFADREVDPADRWSFTPATLPSAGLLAKAGSRTLDAADWWGVGYGTDPAKRGPGGHTHPGGGARMKAPLDFNALNKTSIRLAMNGSRGLGQLCYGDSGGPNYVTLNGVRILAGVTSTGDSPCYATNVAYGTDTPQARDFLDDFVALP